MELLVPAMVSKVSLFRKMYAARPPVPIDSFTAVFDAGRARLDLLAQIIVKFVVLPHRFLQEPQQCFRMLWGHNDA